MSIIFDGRPTIGPERKRKWAHHYTATPMMALCGGRAIVLVDRKAEVTCYVCKREIERCRVEGNVLV